MKRVPATRINQIFLSLLTFFVVFRLKRSQSFSHMSGFIHCICFSCAQLKMYIKKKGE